MLLFIQFFLLVFGIISSWYWEPRYFAAIHGSLARYRLETIVQLTVYFLPAFWVVAAVRDALDQDFMHLGITIVLAALVLPIEIHRICEFEDSKDGDNGFTDVGKKLRSLGRQPARA